MMKSSRGFVSYLTLFLVFFVNFQAILCGEYSKYDAKHYDYESEYKPYKPPEKKSAHVDINIPLDFGTIAKLGVLGMTQLKILFALGKMAGAGLGVSALGLSQLGKISLKLGPVHKGAGIAIDIGPPPHSHHYEGKSYEEKSYHAPSERNY